MNASHDESLEEFRLAFLRVISTAVGDVLDDLGKLSKTASLGKPNNDYSLGYQDGLRAAKVSAQHLLKQAEGQIKDYVADKGSE